MYIGAHVSTNGGVDKAPSNGVQLGCEAIQVFTKNQMQWRAKPLTPSEVDAYKNEFKKSGIQVAVSHDSYLINLGSPEEAKLHQSLVSFEDEVERCEQLGIPFLVFHPGSHVGSGEKAGLATIAASLNQVLEKKRGYRTQLLLETTAGQGSNLGYRFEQLRSIIDLVDEKHRLGVCLDTCHVFAAGYEIRTEEGWPSERPVRRAVKG